jgi:FMN phosphatase YigB (HAD superfamily)
MKFIIENNKTLSDLMGSYKAFVFDLDNTLYEEKDFLFAVYAKIDEYLNGKYGVREYSSFLKNTFLSDGRAQLLDKLIAEYSLPAGEKEVLLSMFRNTIAQPSLSLYEGALDLMAALNRKGIQIFILTNGNIEQQKNKIRSINWETLLDHVSVYYANSYEKKPSPKALLALMTDHGLMRDELVFIGDAESDRLCALDAGVRYVPLETLLIEDK